MADTHVPKILRRYWDFKYLVLLIALTLVMLLPVTTPGLVNNTLFRVAFMGVLLASVLTTARSPRVLVLSTSLALAGQISPPLPENYAQGAHIIFFFLVSATVLAEVMRVEEVTGDKICGAICGYMLLALGFAIVFKLLDDNHPGSFSVDSPSFYHVAYFSFTTITTLGYGDIVPATDMIRALTSIEALCGQFYIAIIVARLVSLYLMNQQNKKEKKDV